LLDEEFDKKTTPCCGSGKVPPFQDSSCEDALDIHLSPSWCDNSRKVNEACTFTTTAVSSLDSKDSGFRKPGGFGLIRLEGKVTHFLQQAFCDGSNAAPPSAGDLCRASKAWWLSGDTIAVTGARLRDFVTRMRSVLREHHSGTVHAVDMVPDGAPHFLLQFQAEPTSSEVMAIYHTPDMTAPPALETLDVSTGKPLSDPWIDIMAYPALLATSELPFLKSD
jgi:hypothetical protein